MTQSTVTAGMKDDADDIEKWARQIEERSNDPEIQRLAARIKRAARDIFD